MDNKNISQIIDEVREDIRKVFGERSGSGPSRLSSDTNIFSVQKFNKVHPKTIEPNLEEYKNVCFSSISSENNIKEDVKNMRIQLKQTYDLLISARDSLEGINFANLKNRIKDLHIYPTDAEIDQILQEIPLDENLDELTRFMKGRFKEHPAENGDIPELNAFFRTCTDLQRGLKDLETQTKNLEELETRVIKATQEEKEHVAKIKNLLNIKDEE